MYEFAKYEILVQMWQVWSLCVTSCQIAGVFCLVQIVIVFVGWWFKTKLLTNENTNCA